MRLKSFNVRVFRNTIDSGDIEVADSTCIVGKNEAGKSATIEALHRLNPAKTRPLTLLDDYPRWLKKEHETTGEIKTAVPIRAEFALSAEEATDLERRFGAGVLSAATITAFRTYDKEELQLELPIDFATFIAWFLGAHVDQAHLGGKLDGLSTSSELIKRFTNLTAEKDDDGELTLAAQAANQGKSALERVLDGAGSLTAAIDAVLRPLIPKTFYFSDYAQLQGRYPLHDVIVALGNDGDDDSPLQSAASFLKLAKVDASNAESWDFEELNAELEAVSSLLTRRVKQNWKQNQHLKLRVRIEAERQSNNQLVRHLQFRVEDTRHDFSNRLDRRSTGFRWFVSFIASFFEFQQDKNIILLLDEPGLSLHARAQKDLLDAIDNNLTDGRQVIYTTHSPFMVRTEGLERVRIVEDKGPELGASVTNDAGLVSDPDTLFPLQAALGYDVAQNLFIGNRNVLLEGTSDFIYLTTLSSHLASLKRAAFPDNCRLLPAGGATNIPTFIALLGTALNMVVLIDGDAQRQRIDAAIAQGRLAAASVLTMDTFCSVKGADIEDLFAPAEYLALYNATFSTNLTEADLKGSDRIVKRIERAAGAFDHGRVAGQFLIEQHAVLATLGAETLTRFEQLIAAITKKLPPT